MFKAYRNFQQAQIDWIRKHPVQYVVLNGVLIVAFIGYVEYKDRKEQREIESQIANEMQ